MLYDAEGRSVPQRDKRRWAHLRFITHDVKKTQQRPRFVNKDTEATSHWTFFCHLATSLNLLPAIITHRLLLPKDVIMKMSVNISHHSYWTRACCNKKTPKVYSQYIWSTSMKWNNSIQLMVARTSDKSIVEAQCNSRYPLPRLKRKYKKWKVFAHNFSQALHRNHPEMSAMKNKRLSKLEDEYNHQLHSTNIHVLL